MSGLTSLCISCLSFMVARWCQSWVKCAFKAGRRWEGGTIHVGSFAVTADALPEAITSLLSLRYPGQKGSRGHAAWGETGKIRSWIVMTELGPPLGKQLCIYNWNPSSQIEAWIHGLGLEPSHKPSFGTWTHDLFIEIEHLASGLYEVQVLYVWSQKEVSGRQSDR